MDSSLLRFPPEVLLLIVQPLPPPDVCKLCLTNKYLRTLAQPTLYTTIKLPWLSNCDGYSPVSKLLRTALRRPDLASHVRKVELEGEDEPEQARFPEIGFRDTELNELIEPINTRIEVPYRTLWIQGLSAGSMDAWVALLISQLPSLEYIFFDYEFLIQTRLIGMMLQSSIRYDGDRNSGIPTFEHLRDVHFNLKPDRGQSVIDNIDFWPLFYLPSIENISIPVRNSSSILWPTGRPPDATNLTTLHVTNTREGTLGPLLSATRNLKNLKWKRRFLESANEGMGVVDLDQMVSVLSRVQNTLTKLKIKTMKFNYKGQTVRHRGSLQPLANFEALKELHIPLGFLLGYSPNTNVSLEEILPRNVESVCLTDDLLLCAEHPWKGSLVYSKILSWLRSYKTSTPHLQSVRIDFGEKRLEEDGESSLRQSLRELCRWNGIYLITRAFVRRGFWGKGRYEVYWD